jgi:hypothetical protein
MLERVGAIRLLKVCEPKTPEDVESTLHVFETAENGMEAVLERVRLKQLRSGGRSALRVDAVGANLDLAHGMKGKHELGESFCGFSEQ